MSYELILSNIEKSWNNPNINLNPTFSLFDRAIMTSKGYFPKALSFVFEQVNINAANPIH